MNKLIFTIAGAGLLTQAFSQTSDCIHAIAICDSAYIQAAGVPDTNAVFNEINTSTSCLPLGEINGRWFRFGSVSAGTLSFSIVPTDTSADYDWILFDLAGRSCSETSTNPATEISCNFSGISGNAGITGANGGSHPTERPTLTVQSGQLYYLYIASYSGDISEYTIDFSGSTFAIKPCSDLGIKDEDASVKIFPNPATDLISVQSQDAIQSYSIVDMHGRTALTGGALMQQHISVASLSPGMYVLVLETGSKSIRKTFLKSEF